MRSFVLGLMLLATGPLNAADPNSAMLDALRPLSGFVGQWQGRGLSQKSSGWKEAHNVTWGFRDRDGRVGIYFTIDHNREGIMNKAALLYDPSSGKYGLLAEMFNGRDSQQMLFLGDLVEEGQLRLERHIEGVDLPSQRIDLKLLRGGDKVSYTLSTRVGTSNVFKPFAEVETFREGGSLENFKSGPYCAVTGGPGWIELTHNGKTYHVADERAKAEFLRNPSLYAK